MYIFTLIFYSKNILEGPDVTTGCLRSEGFTQQRCHKATALLYIPHLHYIPEHKQQKSDAMFVF